MSLHAIIFTDYTLDQTRPTSKILEVGDALIDSFSSQGIKTAGAYKIATVLRNSGYHTKVIPNFHYYLTNYLSDLLNFIIENKETLVLIGFSTSFMTFEKRYSIHYKKLFDLCKENNIKIVLGGAMTYSDYVLDELEITYTRIIGYAETAILKYLELENPPKHFMYDSKTLTYDFHNSRNSYSKEEVITPGETLTLEISRGCRFRCKFCTFDLLGRKVSDNYIRNKFRVYEELINNYDNFKIQTYNIVCDTFNETTEKLEKLLDVVQRLQFKIRFAAYIRLDLLHRYPEQIEILKELGIHGATFGIETLNHTAGKIIGKGLAPQQSIETLYKCKESWGNDVILHSGFIIGLPHDDVKTVKKWSMDIVNGKIPLDSANFTPLSINTDRKFRTLSIFDSDPKKYGYEYDSKNETWYHEKNGWCSKTATKYAEKLVNKSKFKLTAWQYIELLGLGFDKEYLLTIRKNTPEYSHLIQQWKEKIENKIESEKLNLF